MPVLRSEAGEPLRALRDPLAGDSGRPRANREQHNQLRKQSSLGRFLATYGWRAYALPVLAVLTGVVPVWWRPREGYHRRRLIDCHLPSAICHLLANFFDGRHRTSKPCPVQPFL